MLVTMAVMVARDHTSVGVLVTCRPWPFSSTAASTTRGSLRSLVGGGVSDVCRMCVGYLLQCILLSFEPPPLRVHPTRLCQMRVRSLSNGRQIG